MRFMLPVVWNIILTRYNVFRLLHCKSVERTSLSSPTRSSRDQVDNAHLTAPPDPSATGAIISTKHLISELKGSLQVPFSATLSILLPFTSHYIKQFSIRYPLSSIILLFHSTHLHPTVSAFRSHLHTTPREIIQIMTGDCADYCG